jgi:uncharacterized Zn finger protein
MTQPVGFQAKVIQAWRAAIQDFEKGRTRRGKATTKLGRMTHISVKDGAIEARIKGFGGGFGSGTYALSFPCVDWWADYGYQVATWLCRRPDWLAALLAGEWDESFVSFVHEAGLRLLPTEAYKEDLQRRSVCTCSEPNVPCQHVLMVIYEVIEQVSTEPLRMLTYCGLSVPALLDEAHRISARLREEALGAGAMGKAGDGDVGYMESEQVELDKEKALQINIAETRGAVPVGLAPWPEEARLMQAVVLTETPSRSIMPELDSQRLATWRKNHMACDVTGSSS